MRLNAKSLFMALSCGASMAAAPLHAEIINGYHVILTVDGSTSINVSGGGPNTPAQISATKTVGNVTANLAVDANQHTSAKAELSGSGNATARVTASTRYSFHLEPPAGARSVKGGKLVLHVALEGTATGDSDLHLLSSVQADFGNATGSTTITDGTTLKAEFDVITTIAPFIDDISKANGTVRLALEARANLAGSAAAAANATTGTRVTGFRVLDATGAQVTGFTMVADGGNVPETTGGAPSGGSKKPAIEFYHAAFKHYFVSADPVEIAKLDDGTFSGWARTGQSFNVYTNASSTATPVCRFFTVAFPPTSSHVYAPRGFGCEGTMTNAKWQYEGDVFKVLLPDGAGNCPAGSIPVYRLYNQGQGGAPNHRFTTSDETRKQMLAQGFLAEGAGIGVGFCAPQ
ncbi:MAG: hypothetical protein IT518_07450 [Burkholderiales bacterium]|nr:hypothetical protein [Burkholderiales bacterium]